MTFEIALVLLIMVAALILFMTEKFSADIVAMLVLITLGLTQLVPSDKLLDARPPDPEDEVHRMFANVIEEVHVVMGSLRTIQCAVIPSLSLNALAAEDLRGNSLIAITQGLLSRLTRPQIEAVVAHEAHHILSGDCLETTVAASIFCTLSSALQKVCYTSENRRSSVPAFFLAWLLLQLGYLLDLFISREREYRAVAASVRMTRNPLALAEALHLLARSWRGAGFIGSGFEMLRRNKRSSQQQYKGVLCNTPTSARLE